MPGARRGRWHPLLALAAVLVAVAGTFVTVPAASAQPVPAQTVQPTTPTLTPTRCKGHSWFGGVHWCPSDARKILATRSGTGQRVYLTSVVVGAVEPGQVTVQQHLGCASDLCAPECCDLTLHLYWPGTHRPKPYDIVRLYGTTTEGSLLPAGYVRTGVFVPCTDPLLCGSHPREP